MSTTIKKLLDQVKTINISQYKPFAYSVSWIGIVFLVLLIGMKILFSSSYLWLSGIDIMLCVFILIDIIFVNRVSSKNGLQNVKAWLWLLISLLFMNYIWSIGILGYPEQKIFPFRIGTYYIIIIIGILIAQVQNSYYKSNANRRNINLIEDRKSKDKNQRDAKKSKRYKKTVCLIILTVVILLSIFMRIQNLSSIPGVMEDEFYHLGSAMQLEREGTLSYPRAEIQTMLMATSFRIFGPSVTAARLPGIIFGVLTTITIYLLARKINKKVGLIASYLWAISPPAILFSQYAREYSIYLFLMTVFLLSLFWTQKDLDKFKFNTSGIAKILVFIIPVIYYFLSTSSTFQYVLLAYILMAFLLSFSFWKRKIISIVRKKNIKGYMLIVGIGVIVYYIISQNFIRISYQADIRQYYYYFFDPGLRSQWFYGIQISSWVVLILFYLPLIYDYKHKIYRYYSILFTISLLFFIYFFSGGFAPRFAYYILPFYITLISIPLFALGLLNKVIRNKVITNIVIMITMLTFFNPTNTIAFTNNLENEIKNKSTGLRFRSTVETEEVVKFIEDYCGVTKCTVITENPSIYYMYYSKPDLKDNVIKMHVFYRYHLSKDWYKSVSNIIKESENVVYINPRKKVIESKVFDRELIYESVPIDIYKIELAK